RNPAEISEIELLGLVDSYDGSLRSACRRLMKEFPAGSLDPSVFKIFWQADFPGLDAPQPVAAEEATFRGTRSAAALADVGTFDHSGQNAPQSRPEIERWLLREMNGAGLDRRVKRRFTE